MQQNFSALPQAKTLVCQHAKEGNTFGFGVHTLHYREWGAEHGGTPVVCVHGLTRNARDFDYLACTLARDAGFRVIAVDVVGRGESSWFPFGAMYHYGQYLADIQSLLAQLGIVRTHWVGTSMGGIIGMMLEAAQPQIIDRLVLNDVGPFIPKIALRRLADYIGKHMEFKNKSDAMDYLKKTYNYFGIREEGHWEHFFFSSFQSLPDGGYRMRYDPKISYAFRTTGSKIRPLPDFDIWAVWQQVQAPTLLLRGAESDILLRETADMMAQREGVTLVEFPNVGHTPALMDEQQIQVVHHWLTKC